MSEILELAVSPKYAKHWNIGDALREIMANAIDEASRKESKVGYSYKPSILTIINEIGELKRENFVMGGTDKEDGKTIGQFGEGLKVGAVVLLRNGKKISGSSGDMKFKFQLSFSEKWNSEIMLIEIENVPFTQGTKIFVDGITYTQVKEFLNRFLIFKELEPIVKSPEGSIYLGDGELYTHGVLISDKWGKIKSHPEYSLSFNIANVELNRDRTIFSDWRVVREIGEILYQAKTENAIRAIVNFWMYHEKMADLLPYGHPKADDIKIWRKVIMERFQILDNDKFAVAKSDIEAHLLQEWGYNPICGPAGFREACESEFDFLSAKEALGKAGEYVLAKEINSWEQRNLTKAEDWAKTVITKIPGVKVIPHCPIFVFEKRLDEKPESKEAVHLGVFKEGNIGIRRSQLAKEIDAKATILHEYLHAVFGNSDNTRAFEIDQERALKAILANPKLMG